MVLKDIVGDLFYLVKGVARHQNANHSWEVIKYKYFVTELK